MLAHVHPGRDPDSHRRGTIQAADFTSRGSKKRFRYKVTFAEAKPGEGRTIVPDFT